MMVISRSMLSSSPARIISPTISQVFRHFCTARKSENIDMMKSSAEKVAKQRQNNTNKSSNIAYLKAYTLAMVGDYDPLYKLHLAERGVGGLLGAEHNSKWARADARTSGEVLLRLYNFEKRLLVAGLALMYCALLALFLALAAYLRAKATALRQQPNAAAAAPASGGGGGDIVALRPAWEAQFGKIGEKDEKVEQSVSKVMPFEVFLKQHFFSGKVRHVAFYNTEPPVLMVTLESDDDTPPILFVECPPQSANKTAEISKK